MIPVWEFRDEWVFEQQSILACHHHPSSRYTTFVYPEGHLPQWGDPTNHYPNLATPTSLLRWVHVESVHLHLLPLAETGNCPKMTESLPSWHSTSAPTPHQDPYWLLPLFSGHQDDGSRCETLYFLQLRLRGTVSWEVVHCLSSFVGTSCAVHQFQLILQVQPKNTIFYVPMSVNCTETTEEGSQPALWEV